jgi:hypothetical protein
MRMAKESSEFPVYTQQIGGFTIINGFICEYDFLPGECEMNCNRCNHALDYLAGGHPGDRRLEDLEKEVSEL